MYLVSFDLALALLKDYVICLWFPGDTPVLALNLVKTLRGIPGIPFSKLIKLHYLIFPDCHSEPEGRPQLGSSHLGRLQNRKP